MLRRRCIFPGAAKAAAGYFSSVKFTKWMRVVESATVPKFTASVNGLFLREEGNETVPLGNRLVEMPESTYDTNILRNPRSGFVVYAPIGSLKKGVIPTVAKLSEDDVIAIAAYVSSLEP